MSEAKKQKAHAPESKAKAGLKTLRDMNATNDSGQEYGGVPRRLNCPPKAAAGRIA